MSGDQEKEHFTSLEDMDSEEKYEALTKLAEELGFEEELPDKRKIEESEVPGRLTMRVLDENDELKHEEVVEF